MQREILSAQSAGKPVIPIMLKQTDVTILLQGLHWIDFRTEYEQKLPILQARLYQLTLAPVVPSQLVPSGDPTVELPAIEANAPEPSDLVPAAPELPPPDPDLNYLYQTGIEALTANDLERAASLRQQILDREPKFRNGQVADDMAELRPKLHAARLATAIEQAELATREKHWRQAISAWQEVSDLEQRNAKT